MDIETYLQKIQLAKASGRATEHSYRPYLQQLIKSVAPEVEVTNEPRREACGAPDYILTKKSIPIGYIEAKDLLPRILDKRETQGQIQKYFDGGLGQNFVLTDYLEFRFYRDSSLVDQVRIAEISEKELTKYEDEYNRLLELLRNFALYQGQTIRSSKRLAQMMAAKARMIKTVILKALEVEEDESSELHEQLSAFQNILMHDMTQPEFADMYAQTITYGLFAARLHDPTLENFSRMEAAELLPKTNPFLRRLFGRIGALDLDSRLTWIVDDLVEVFKACNVRELLDDYGKASKRNDPVVHFYEEFLAEYDKKLRKSRGVWYTPEPVVDFIVRALDDILKSDFNLSDGLADTSKIDIQVQTQGSDLRRRDNKKRANVSVHRVQILDPAVGTGTFLARVFHQIHEQLSDMPALWQGYVNNDLLPRVHGFEILMAPYAMAHLKLDHVLRGLGGKPEKRFSVYLTNSLEEAHPDTGTLFASWLSQESTQANHIKRDMPIMCVLGNPPYSVSSSNRGEWIEHLMKSYKAGLDEKNINPLSDDYIKFIRFAEYFIQRNGTGILAFISNNSFIDGIIHRQMREHLLTTFDKIYVYDLHGNSNKRELTPEGKPDNNVFDIQQGVSISLMVKATSSKKAAKVFHYDAWGKRSKKYKDLESHSITSDIWQILEPKAPHFFFVPKDYEAGAVYEQFFGLAELFQQFITGVTSSKDDFVIALDREVITERVGDLTSMPIDELKSKYPDVKEGKDWTFARAKEDLTNNKYDICQFLYRPFDIRFSAFTGRSNGFMVRPRGEVMSHMLSGANVALIVPKQVSEREEAGGYISSSIGGHKTFSAYNRNYYFPLYLYPDKSQLTLDGTVSRRTNLNPSIVKLLASKLEIRFVPDHEATEAKAKGTCNSLDIIDYVYAVLHSPVYRERYREFLKIDFPRIPYPKDVKAFWHLVNLGRDLREIHLLKSPKLDKHGLRLDGGTDTKIVKGSYNSAEQRIYINEEVYFEDIPESVWSLYIGGYQPAQKWLADRKGHSLSLGDARQFMKILAALAETERLMHEIASVDL